MLKWQRFTCVAERQSLEHCHVARVCEGCNAYDIVTPWAVACCLSAPTVRILGRILMNQGRQTLAIMLLGRMLTNCEPVWPSGQALGWKAEVPRFESASALLSLQKLWSVDTVL